MYRVFGIVAIVLVCCLGALAVCKSGVLPTRVKKVLLAPSKGKVDNPRTWVLSRMDYVHTTGRVYPVSNQVYEEFYQTIERVKSVSAKKAPGRYGGTLILTLSPAGKFAQGEKKQRVEFSLDGEWFRLEKEGKWLYFHQEGVGHEAYVLFVRNKR